MTSIIPNFDPSILPKPITRTEVLARQLLERGNAAGEWEGVGGEGGARLSPFGPRAFFLANAIVPPGHIQITPAQITMVIVGERRPLRKFLHRLRSMRRPCKTTFMSGPGRDQTDINYAYKVQLDELQVLEEPNSRNHIAITIQLAILEWIPKAQLPTIDVEEGDEWEELEPIKTACVRLREENRIHSRAESAWTPKALNSCGWRMAIANVLDHCNQSTFPKSFNVAWSFVTKNLVLTTYTKERESNPAIARDRLRSAILPLGEERWRVVESAIDGYERGLKGEERMEVKHQ